MASKAAPLRTRLLRRAWWGLVVGLGSQLALSCLSIGDTRTDATGGVGGGAGTGGTSVSDAPWGTGGTSEAGEAGAAGSGGFVAGPCDGCATPGACECVPEVGQGWAHVRIADGQQKACPDGSKVPVVVGTGAVDTGCGTCECGSPTGGVCGFALVFYSNTSCIGTGSYGTIHTTSGECVPTGVHPGISPKAFGTGGYCDTGTASPKPPEFAASKSLCTQASSGACGTAGACVPTATGAFDAKACVMFESQGVDVACPSGYPSKLPFSTGFDDTRTCSCKCKASIYCSGGNIVYGCASGSGNEANSCRDSTVAGDYKIVATPTVASAGCDPDGASTPQGGSVAASGLRVVCCR